MKTESSRRRLRSCDCSSSSDEDGFDELGNFQKIQKTLSDRRHRKLAIDRETTSRRPVWFWSEFNNWWRQELDRLGKRPGKPSIVQWYELNATRVWPQDTPSFTETRLHAKCLRSTEAVRDYFRRYRAARKEQQNEHAADGHSHGGAATSGGGASGDTSHIGASHPDRHHCSARINNTASEEDAPMDPAALIAQHNMLIAKAQGQQQIQARIQMQSVMYASTWNHPLLPLPQCSSRVGGEGRSLAGGAAAQAIAGGVMWNQQAGGKEKRWSDESSATDRGTSSMCSKQHVRQVEGEDKVVAEEQGLEHIAGSGDDGSEIDEDQEDLEGGCWRQQPQQTGMPFWRQRPNTFLPHHRGAEQQPHDGWAERLPKLEQQQAMACAPASQQRSQWRPPSCDSMPTNTMPYGSDAKPHGAACHSSGASFTVRSGYLAWNSTALAQQEQQQLLLRDRHQGRHRLLRVRATKCADLVSPNSLLIPAPPLPVVPMRAGEWLMPPGGAATASRHKPDGSLVEAVKQVEQNQEQQQQEQQHMREWYAANGRGIGGMMCIDEGDEMEMVEDDSDNDDEGVPEVFWD
ncbi:hypothetical protein VOLCADRAFT_97525 [Volvox carteri f. nagariensis]|uniref:Uncharacterized protein n=1 Tax=Volvox carteri f. nagariensis TaxID=3068 RepID=D8UCY7_VOLCA|nr:uncharacterized protein VOLCADRAFT_97525 [Volvox carteri f. nagariensis]EFJ42472.1 hypothetical protein VOLCADRAFT_97525 [Volvox carteri f. nagariensis]|eukprot:XP_002956535.1 hypothetical protein VOLCADRAFT_97525 [Volvox carteri f. nagariensis]